jgi:DNA-binding CsgD family transcriptional regulator
MQKQNFRSSVNQFIGEFINPFKKQGMVQFSQSITFGNNQMVFLGSSIEVSTYFNKHKIPIYCSDESGRILDEGVYTNKILESSYRECALIFPVLKIVGHKFKLNYGKNSLHIIEKEDDCQHLYTLYFDLEENDFIYWSLNNGRFIHDTIENYKLKAWDLILEGKSLENRSTRNNFNELNIKNHFYSSRSSSKKELVNLFHKNSNLAVFLSPQQAKCLLLLIHGKSIKQIGLELNLSHRTVETYLQTIRNMLGCSSGKELISTYYESIKKQTHKIF